MDDLNVENQSPVSTAPTSAPTPNTNPASTFSPSNMSPQSRPTFSHGNTAPQNFYPSKPPVTTVVTPVEPPLRKFEPLDINKRIESINHSFNTEYDVKTQTVGKSVETPLPDAPKEEIPAEQDLVNEALSQLGEAPLDFKTSEMGGKTQDLPPVTMESKVGLDNPSTAEPVHTLPLSPIEDKEEPINSGFGVTSIPVTPITINEVSAPTMPESAVPTFPAQPTTPVTPDPVVPQPVISVSSEPETSSIPIHPVTDFPAQGEAIKEDITSTPVAPRPSTPAPSAVPAQVVGGSANVLTSKDFMAKLDLDPQANEVFEQASQASEPEKVFDKVETERDQALAEKLIREAGLSPELVNKALQQKTQHITEEVSSVPPQTTGPVTTEEAKTVLGEDEYKQEAQDQN